MTYILTGREEVRVEKVVMGKSTQQKGTNKERRERIIKCVCVVGIKLVIKMF